MAIKMACGARTRQGSPCKAKALPNGRCRNHGGLSTGPRTEAGKKRISEAQKYRWKSYRDAMRTTVASTVNQRLKVVVKILV